jgi:hypothetical protein
MNVFAWKVVSTDKIDVEFRNIQFVISNNEHTA